MSLGGGPSTGGAGGSGGAGGIDPGVGGSSCLPGPDDDLDGDGFSLVFGDCDDCDPLVAPSAIEVALPDRLPVDEDCDGLIDEPPDPPCDDDLALAEPDALTAARALELCKLVEGPLDWGLLDARWVLPDGSDPPQAERDLYHLGHGLMPDFGPNLAVRRGARLLALSSGTARRPLDPDFQPTDGFYKNYVSQHPDGFPIESPACGPIELGLPNDAAALEVSLVVPANAFGLTFDFAFYTHEWPDFVCTPFDDFFVALLDPPPPGSVGGNVSFDAFGNPVSVNNAFLEVCGCDGNPPDPCTAGGKVFECGLGNAELIGTGFGFDTTGRDHASTSWLTTEAPVDRGSVITLRFAIYDSSDGALDSTVLIDNVAWRAEPGMLKTGRAPR